MRSLAYFGFVIDPPAKDRLDEKVAVENTRVHLPPRKPIETRSSIKPQTRLAVLLVDPLQEAD